MIAPLTFTSKLKQDGKLKGAEILVCKERHVHFDLDLKTCIFDFMGHNIVFKMRINIETNNNENCVFINMRKVTEMDFKIYFVL